MIDRRSTQRLLGRHPANVVRLDLPGEEPGDEPDDRYRRAARTLAAWRSDGTLHKDPHPSIYVYEQTYRVPGTDVERTQRGFFAPAAARGRSGPESGVLPHERTLSGPREDRYKLLRATGVNTSPVVVLYDDPAGAGAPVLEAATSRAADVDLSRRRRGPPPAVGRAGRRRGRRRRRAAARRGRARGPVTIADGHHRYETALRYRDERRMSPLVRGGPGVRLPPDAVPRGDRAAADRPADPSDPAEPRRRPASGGSSAGLDELFEVRRAGRRGRAADDVRRGRPGRGWRRAVRALDARRRGAACGRSAAPSSQHLPRGGDALRALDVTLLGVALERLAGIGPDAVAGGAVATPSRRRRRSTRVDRAVDGADAAFLLEPTPVASIAAVARDGDVMPQKSTYFYPKALTGLVINPHEW